MQYSKFAEGSRCPERPWSLDEHAQLYEYLIYLRHHGFPSPLLDWSRSPYVAAYFAFDNVKSKADVAIYAFRKRTAAPKEIIGGEPRIVSGERYVRSHERHYLQQSEYTVCFGKDESGLGSYVSHDDVLANASGGSDKLMRFVLSRSLRQEVLRYLQRHNITAFSLFGSEESLMKTLAVERFIGGAWEPTE